MSEKERVSNQKTPACCTPPKSAPGSNAARPIDHEALLLRCQHLIETLPYIRAFSGKIVVIKYGGSAMIDETLKQSVIMDIVLMKCVGIHPVLVHGGGPEITRMMDRLGKKAEFIKGLRVTDTETMEIIEMVLGGSINKSIVSLINQAGGRAVGLSGKDANLIRTKKVPPVDGVDMGHVGEIERTDVSILHTLIREGYIPVVAPMGMDEDGVSHNVNGDTVAGKICAELKAEKFIMLTDQSGVLRNVDDPESLISSIRTSEVAELKENGIISGGMIPKIAACLVALSGGTPKAHIIDGRLEHSILLEVFTDGGIGTEIVEHD